MPPIFAAVLEAGKMKRSAWLVLLALLAGCAGTGQDVRTDIHTGATVVESETLGVGFFTVEAKTIFSWHSDAPETILVTVYLVGVKNINDVSFGLNGREMKLHTDAETAHRNSGSYSKNSFALAWPDFLALAKATSTGEVKMLVAGPGNPGLLSTLDMQYYKARLLPFVDKVKELKRYRSPIS
jgi:hypothetical protein